MGFGSYDESEQNRRESSPPEDDPDGVNVHENEHHGQIRVESDLPTADLVHRLREMRENAEEE